MAPGPWLTRDLKECVLASDYDALAAENAALKAQLAYAAIDAFLAADSASAVQSERCCVDYPRCDCNSPPEPDNLPCGHPASLLLMSAETGEALYCELCDDKSGRRDAEQCETELRAEVERLKTALKTVGDDYPGSSCQQWCYEAAGIRAPAEWPTREEAEKRAAELMAIGRATLGENDDWLCFQRPTQPKVTP